MKKEMDELDIFKRIGLNDQNQAREAMNLFLDEYSKITGIPAEGVNAILQRPDDIEPEDDRAIDEVAPLLDDTNLAEGVSTLDLDRTINIKLVLANIKKWFSKGTLPVAKRIARMISDNDTDIEPVGDYVRMAAHVYGDLYDSILPHQWQCLGNEYNNIRLDDPKSGLRAMLYVNQQQCETPHYAYAISGTQDVKDWLTNLGQVVGISDQHDRAAEVAEGLAAELGVENLTIVGHSKGGGQAAYCALRTGCDAITFNPAGLGLYKFNLERPSTPRIDSFVMTTDPLNIFQLVAQLIAFDITADGSVHYLKPAKHTAINIENTHGMAGFLHLLGINL